MFLEDIFSLNIKERNISVSLVTRNIKMLQILKNILGQYMRVKHIKKDMNVIFVSIKLLQKVI